LFQVLNHINHLTEGEILQYQIIQKGFTDFLVYVVLDDDYNEDIFDEIIIGFKKRLWRGVNVNIYLLEDFMNDYKTEKLACFIYEEES